MFVDNREFTSKSELDVHSEIFSNIPRFLRCDVSMRILTFRQQKTSVSGPALWQSTTHQVFLCISAKMSSLGNN